MDPKYEFMHTHTEIILIPFVCRLKLFESGFKIVWTISMKVKIGLFRDYLYKGHIGPPVLALCGNSGCGKSTTVELICREIGVEVLSWSEDSWDVDSSASITNVKTVWNGNRSGM